MITVENISKRYIIGSAKQESRGLRHVFSDLMQRKKSSEVGAEFWALKEVNFEVKQGETLGVIGRNGAGKSTLMKILSRITEPTSGRIKLGGRVASLLEVGTGFHPELTGRENIFLNGTILGMSRKEIRSKLDEIIAFAEVEEFIETPVKRYSSGMYVRLAFAVAAHLEPDILLVDEVLSVGDASFQKKSLGKMKEVSEGGRTVLFVSHSMPTVTSLCSRCILLDRGQIVKQGPASEVVLDYYSQGESSCASAHYPGVPSRSTGVERDADEIVGLLHLSVENEKGEVSPTIEIDEKVKVRVRYRIFDKVQYALAPNLHFFRADGVCAFVSFLPETPNLETGDYEGICHIPAFLLNEGVYFVGLSISSFHQGVVTHVWQKNALTFNVRDPIVGVRNRGGYPGVMPGAMRPTLEWSHGKIH